MPKAFMDYVHYIELMNRRLGRILSGGILLLLAVLLIEGVLRYVFNQPTVWSIELSIFILGTYFFIGGASVLLSGGHVRMDLFYSNWSPKKRAIFDMATFPLMAVYLFYFVRIGIDEAAWSLSLGHRSASQWHPPLGPIKIIIVVGGILLLLQGIAFLIRDIAIIRGQRIR